MLGLIENTVSIMDVQANLKSGEIVTIKSRFGDVEVDVSKAIYFPKGILGFPENLHFALLNFPSPRPDLSQFKILQCINDHSISLPVLPVAYENNFIEKADMEECIKSVEVKKENFAMLFIMSSQKQMEGFFRLFINTKAPIIIDTSLQMAVQYVFTNNKYNVRESLDSKKQAN